MAVGGVPFLTITEFVRAKVKAWALYVRLFMGIERPVNVC